jgi:hypothetical protein
VTHVRGFGCLGLFNLMYVDSWLPIAAQLVDLPGELFDGVSKKFAIRCYAKYYAVQNKVPFVAAVTTTAMSNPGRVYVALTLHPVVQHDESGRLANRIRDLSRQDEFVCV